MRLFIRSYHQDCRNGGLIPCGGPGASGLVAYPPSKITLDEAKAHLRERERHLQTHPYEDALILDDVLYVWSRGIQMRGFQSFQAISWEY
jgi:hypothetical protein